VEEDRFRALVEAYALGALDAGDRRDFDAHLRGCVSCGGELTAFRGVLEAWKGEPPAVAPDPHLREELLDLADAPSTPLDLDRYEWVEHGPGVKVHVVKEDPARGMRACLAWGRAGSRMPRHRHGGVENILVLSGRLRDERGVYGPGEVCRSASGSVHTEEALEDCLCYVVYYGELEFLEGSHA
jgi:anti-sigma factor ChrR (cupin superfamily)